MISGANIDRVMKDAIWNVNLKLAVGYRLLKAANDWSRFYYVRGYHQIIWHEMHLLITRQLCIVKRS